MTSREAPNLMARARANIEELGFFGLYPSRLRSYRAPDSASTFWDQSEYSSEDHEQNIDALRNTLDVHAGESNRTPWLTTGIGVVSVKYAAPNFRYTSVSLADDRMAYRQGLHFVRHDIDLHETKGIKARTRIYPTLSKTFANFTTSDAAWAMSYPVLSRHPEAVSREIQETLLSPHELEPATTQSIKETFPDRNFALRHWVGVKID